MAGRWNLEFNLDSRTIAHVRRLVSQLVTDEGADAEVVGEIEVAVGEVLVNAHRHAYHGRPGPLQVEIALTPDRVDILIRDHGAPITSPPTIPRRRPVRVSEGLGLYMVGKLMDEATVIHTGPEGRGMAVRLGKDLRAAHDPGDDGLADDAETAPDRH